MPTPIGNSILVKQNLPLVAKMWSNFQNRLDLQEAIGRELLKEKKKEIQKIKPTEKIEKIDPENEQEKSENKNNYILDLKA